jgi:DnaJ-class molecular chaperone
MPWHGKAALKYHPDKQRLTGNASDDSSMFLKIIEASTVLSNESLRASSCRELEIGEPAGQLDRQRQAMIDELAGGSRTGRPWSSGSLSARRERCIEGDESKARFAEFY